jgi:YidC/Oxa1 family membrane protein insertase
LAEFKNPNQQGGQDNNSFLIMMFVVLAVVFGVQYYHMKKNPPPATPTAPAASQSTAATPAPASEAPAPAAPAAEKTAEKSSSRAAKAAAVPEASTIAATAESTTVIENELYRVVFSNRGADVRSWVLKRNPSTGEAFTDDEGNPLDLVHELASSQFGYPLSINTSDNNLNARLKQLLYVSSAQGTLSAPAKLSFTYQDASLKVVKTFTFGPTYVIHADVQVTFNGQPVRAAISWPSGFGDEENASGFSTAEVETMSEGKTKYLAVKKVSGNALLNGPFDWAGVSDTYFAAIFMPDQPNTAALTTFRNEIDLAKVVRKGQTPPSKSTMAPVLGVGLAGDPGNTSTSIFVGPKAVDILKNTHTADGQNLEPVLNFGFFGVIAKYLFLLLKIFHVHVVANWGWAIILMTVIINVLILPLRAQSMKSALKMQRIQPQVNAIKARYKNPKATDPKSAEMNAEVMKLYKENHVNMFGGCLPSLIPLPLFYAFYAMLPNVVELRHAPWLWLRDLSAPDPLHILPILTIVAMFFTSFLTPSPGVDPQQQKMMAFMMPVFFGVIVWNYGSGLAIYWLTGSIISIAAQLVMNQTGMGREMRELAAKRARRGKGKATTIQGKR